jgi:NAD(P)-dependent dehydrogenase (short-subunit alcohol dehydrogenase family)
VTGGGNGGNGRRVAVVTGASSGIGRAIAQRLLGLGVQVVGVGRDDRRLRATGEVAPDRYHPVVADLATDGGRAAVIAEVFRRFDTVWALVNDAAEVLYESPTTLDPAAWRRIVDLNLLAPVELVRALGPRLRGGHVVNVSSVTARSPPGAKFGPYAVTKSALETWTEALRLENGDVRVTLIAPGLVDTPLYDHVAGFEKTRAKLRQDVPIWLSPDDVAEAVVWALTRPSHVVASEIVLLPRGQTR